MALLGAIRWCSWGHKKHHVGYCRNQRLGVVPLVSGNGAGTLMPRPHVHFIAHSRIVLSPLPEARILPLGLKATLFTTSVWPVRGRPSCRWVVTLHSRTVLSKLPEASVLPSGLKATLDTTSVWPVRG